MSSTDDNIKTPGKSNNEDSIFGILNKHSNKKNKKLPKNDEIYDDLVKEDNYNYDELNLLENNGVKNNTDNTDNINNNTINNNEETPQIIEKYDYGQEELLESTSKKNKKFDFNWEKFIDGFKKLIKDDRDYITIIKDEINEIYDELEEQVLSAYKSEYGEYTYVTDHLQIKDEYFKSDNVVYPVMPPFQYAAIKDIDGITTYIPIEPILDKKEEKLFKILDDTFDKLIVIEIPAFEEFDKKQFLWEKFLDIISLYGWRLKKITKHKLFFNLLKKHLYYEKIDILMNDTQIEDISCNGLNVPIFIYHRIFESIPTLIIYDDEVELNNFILRMAQMGGKHVSLLQPIKDLALPDGSRVNLTVGKEVSKKGSTFTIRKFRSNPISPIELAKSGSVNLSLLSYMWFILDYKKSLLVSGGTAAGKTTFLNAVAMFIKPEYKVVSIEDTPEINLHHPNWAQMITRSGFGTESNAASVSGLSGVSAAKSTPGEIGLFDLLVAALRQRPEYILVGEVRGPEAFTLFQAIAVGHACLGTIHAGTMQELISRLESPPMTVPRVLFSNVDVVVFPALIKKGGKAIRRVKYVVEILGMESESKNLITNTVFKWDPVEDKMEYLGRSYIIEKIQDELGFSNEYIEEELSRREAILQDMYDNKIFDYREVTKRIHEYIKERNKIEMMQHE